jgi:hypothetical protein
VNPVPDPLLLRKSGSCGNRTRNLWICGQELWPLDHGSGLYLNTNNTTFVITEPWTQFLIREARIRLVFEMQVQVGKFLSEEYPLQHPSPSPTLAAHSSDYALEINQFSLVFLRCSLRPHITQKRITMTCRFHAAGMDDIQTWGLTADVFNKQ